LFAVPVWCRGRRGALLGLELELGLLSLIVCPLGTLLCTLLCTPLCTPLLLLLLLLLGWNHAPHSVGLRETHRAAVGLGVVVADEVRAAAAAAAAALFVHDVVDVLLRGRIRRGSGAGGGVGTGEARSLLR